MSRIVVWSILALGLVGRGHAQEFYAPDTISEPAKAVLRPAMEATVR